MASQQVTALFHAGGADQLFKQFDMAAIQAPRLALYKGEEMVQSHLFTSNTILQTTDA